MSSLEGMGSQVSIILGIQLWLISCVMCQVWVGGSRTEFTVHLYVNMHVP